MSKGTWNIGVVKVIEREKILKQAVVLAMGWKCRKHCSVRGVPGPALQLFVVPVKTR